MLAKHGKQFAAAQQVVETESVHFPTVLQPVEMLALFAFGIIKGKHVIFFNRLEEVRRKILLLGLSLINNLMTFHHRIEADCAFIIAFCVFDHFGSGIFQHLDVLLLCGYYF